jgi:hypothetical protein
VSQENLVPTAVKRMLASRAPSDHRVHLVMPDQQASQVPLVHQEVQACLAMTPPIVRVRNDRWHLWHDDSASIELKVWIFEKKINRLIKVNNKMAILSS